MTTEEFDVQEEVVKILEASQISSGCHQKNCMVLRKLYELVVLYVLVLPPLTSKFPLDWSRRILELLRTTTWSNPPHRFEGE